MKNKWLVLLITLLFLTGCNNDKTMSTNVNNNINDSVTNNKLISASDAKKMYDENIATIIDVRSLEEYEELHIDGAINIPVEMIESNIQLKIPDKDSNIIVYCKSGLRSSAAKDKLESLEYSNVYDLGSIDNWIYDIVSN